MSSDPHTYLPEFCTKKTLILGCGNRLFGDDGFGPAVAEHMLATYELPEDVSVLDAGTSVRKLLFTLCISSSRPERIIIVDSVDKGRKPGEIFELSLDDIPLEKRDDFSLHHAPTSNLAKELKESGVDVHVMACQIDSIPDSVMPGLSASVARAVPLLSDQLAKTFLNIGNGPYELLRETRSEDEEAFHF